MNHKMNEYGLTVRKRHWVHGDLDRLLGLHAPTRAVQRSRLRGVELIQCLLRWIVGPLIDISSLFLSSTRVEDSRLRRPNC